MKRLVIFAAPVLVVGVTVAVPFVFGNHPLKFDKVAARSGSSISPDPGPGVVVAGSGGQSPAASPSPSDTYQGPRVAKAWQQGAPEWGIQVYWLDDPADPENFVQGKADRIIQYVVGLKANSISISFPFYTGGRTSNELFTEPTSPTPDRLALLVDAAHRAGLRTVIRPILDEVVLKPQAGGWRGNITPSDRTRWFASYSKLLTPYLKMAAEHQAEAFTIGTELNSLEGDPSWQGLMDQAKGLFPGRIGYDSNWDNYVKGQIQVPAQEIGVDAYFPARKSTDDAPVSELVASWNTWLDKKGKGPLPGTTLTEVGIPAQQGAYQAPGDFYTRRAANNEVQARWFAAVCQVANERKLGGVYFWSAYFGTDPNQKAEEDTPRMEFAGRSATEQAIRDCFSGDYQVPAH
ncbi:hypothetical protein OHV05_21740 [Kitasatospora sp. NBC_00070]|uniref:glycoside hydrolase family 113 n=1 Tax=Kitasatospora sp. NBC_00070 TaxID=2975962 RepID=UPI00324E1D6D